MSAKHDISCERCVEFLVDYLDGALPELERVTFEAHLALCRNCRVYLDNYRKVIDLARQTGSATPERLPEGAPREILEAIRKACGNE